LCISIVRDGFVILRRSPQATDDESDFGMDGTQSTITRFCASLRMTGG